MEATEFSSKVVLITGAASGIGLAAAKRFTQGGLHVYA
ncbi:SDR family NAD(P)-dependent oxidoreductase [Salipaludibacillus sp. LMS25]|jgi:NAD(P)-dependent dehydrogenase (short-subunit alcohol dehydrogenase family)|nr:SDR family NAD(P)-dependent oxidoreductase [Salipaludibacillus sp. LMS25]UTR15771.1 SDR family NAD(P)-dependent oxidoreductase [Salipaludibacillus sp. LMS25]